MTSDQEREFEHHWPALALRVNRLMRRKKISPWLAEDLTQETGLRLIRMWPKIDQTQPLWPLVATIALNLMRDEMRKDGSYELTYSVPDSPSTENVERRGLARLELRAVEGALAQMGDKHRHVLLAEVSEPTDSTDPSATRMLRMRARRKLQNLLDHASLLGIALGDHMRRIVRETEVIITKVLPANAEHLSAAAISLLAALSLGVAIGPETRSEAGAARAHQSAGVSTEAPGAGAPIRTSSGRLDDNERVAAGRTARTGGASDRRDRDRSGGGTPGGRGNAGGDEMPLPGAMSYWVDVTDDTYAYGTVEAEIVGEDDVFRRESDAPPEGTGSINCTIAPASYGASCSHSGEGWSERGVRANHDGGAMVAGHRIY